MADNYIERQYEQYEARKAAWEKKNVNKERRKRFPSSFNQRPDRQYNQTS